jgi:hypothetical protein
MLICPLSVLAWRFEPTIVVVLLALALALMLILLATRLAVSSVQNKHKAKTRSQGASLGIGGSGVNSVGFHFFGIVGIVDVIGGGIAVFACLSWIAVRQCYVKPNITAKQVNITTQDHTQLTGSLIAATDTGDKDGNDNGQLSLTTNIAAA